MSIAWFICATYVLLVFGISHTRMRRNPRPSSCSKFSRDVTRVSSSKMLARCCTQYWRRWSGLLPIYRDTYCPANECWRRMSAIRMLAP